MYATGGGVSKTQDCTMTDTEHINDGLDMTHTIVLLVYYYYYYYYYHHHHHHHLHYHHYYLLTRLYNECPGEDLASALHPIYVS